MGDEHDRHPGPIIASTASATYCVDVQTESISSGRTLGEERPAGRSPTASSHRGQVVVERPVEKLSHAEPRRPPGWIVRDLRR